MAQKIVYIGLAVAALAMTLLATLHFVLKPSRHAVVTTTPIMSPAPLPAPDMIKPKDAPFPAAPVAPIEPLEHVPLPAPRPAQANAADIQMAKEDAAKAKPRAHTRKRHAKKRSRLDVRWQRAINHEYKTKGFFNANN
jgi:hypothetical protein